MKIAIDASILSRKKVTGINRYLQNLLKYIPEIDKKNEYFLFAPCKLEKYKNKGFNVISTRENYFIPDKYYFPLWLNFVLPSFLKKVKPDVFFQPNFFLPLFYKNKIKFIIAIHDLIPQIAPQYRGFAHKTYLNAFLPFSIKKSQAIVTDSENTKKDIINFYKVPAEKINVVYEAADEKFKQRELSEERKEELILKYSLPTDFILHVGAIEKRKNIISILKTGDLIKQFGKDIKIVLIGKPGFKSREIFKEIEKRENIFYIGYVEEEDLPYIYNLAKVFFFPSLYEGFGFPPLEAMQSGVPVLTSNASSLPEIVGEGGILHEPDNCQGFAKDIIKILEDENFYQEMKGKAILQAKKFRCEKFTKQLVDIFDVI